MAEKLKATLVLEIHYEGDEGSRELDDADISFVKEQLDQLVRDAASRGNFTGDSDLTVDTWRHTVGVE